MKNEIDYNKGAIDKLADDYAKLVEENEKYKDFYDNWFNVATDYLKLKEENERLKEANNEKATYIEEMESELTQAKDRIEELENENKRLDDGNTDLHLKIIELTNKCLSLESKCKGLEEKQIGFAEWLIKNGWHKLSQDSDWEHHSMKDKSTQELYAIYSQTLLNG